MRQDRPADLRARWRNLEAVSGVVHDHCDTRRDLARADFNWICAHYPQERLAALRFEKRG